MSLTALIALLDEASKADWGTCSHPGCKHKAEVTTGEGYMCEKHGKQWLRGERENAADEGRHSLAKQKKRDALRRKHGGRR